MSSPGAVGDIELSWELPEGMETPSLVVDYDVLLSNISSMGAELEKRGVALRPHAKTHKSPDIARLQLEHGAIGLTLASLEESEVFSRSGADDIFIAYPLFLGPGKVSRLRRLAGTVRMSVGIDSIDSARRLSDAGLGSRLEVLVEVDPGQHRTGVPAERAGELAAAATALGLRVTGVFTHGGHGYRSPGAAPEAADDEVSALMAASEELSARGISCERLSAGSTPTALMSSRGPVTEERPGTYVFNDRQQVALGAASGEDVAVAIAATVVSTAVDGCCVLDAGSKSLSSDRQAWLEGHGVVPELKGSVVVALSECHGIVRLAEGVAPPAVGTPVRVVPNHVCSAVNLFDSYEVVSGGEVVDRWPVAARGHLR